MHQIDLCLTWVRDKYVNRINELLTINEGNNPLLLKFDVGSKPDISKSTAPNILQSNAVKRSFLKN